MVSRATIIKSCGKSVIALLGGVSMACALPSGALAQGQEVSIDADTDWEHQWTDMRFPAQLDEFARNQLIQFQERETDIAANYEDDAGNVLSIYVYRPGLADTSIWHDRALVAMGANDIMFGSEGVQGKRSATFAPVGSENESGLLTVLTSKGDFRSTGIALYSSGEWLVKVRLSSRGLDPDGLEALLRKTLKLLPEMQGYSAQAAYLIDPCVDELTYTDAERVEGNNFEEALIITSGLLVVSKAEEGAPKASIPETQYCRIGDGGMQGSIYRQAEFPDTYLIAFGDSGTSATARDNTSLADVLSSVNIEADADSDKNDRGMFFELSYATSTELLFFRPFTSLPSPNQAAQAVFNENPIVKVFRGLGDESSETTILVTKDEGVEKVDIE